MFIEFWVQIYTFLYQWIVCDSQVMFSLYIDIDCIFGCVSVSYELIFLCDINCGYRYFATRLLEHFRSDRYKRRYILHR